MKNFQNTPASLSAEQLIQNFIEKFDSMEDIKSTLEQMFFAFFTSESMESTNRTERIDLLFHYQQLMEHLTAVQEYQTQYRKPQPQMLLKTA